MNKKTEPVHENAMAWLSFQTVGMVHVCIKGIKELWALPGYNEIDRVWFGVDGSFGETKFINRPELITEEAARVDNLVADLQTSLGSISSSI